MSARTRADGAAGASAGPDAGPGGAPFVFEGVERPNGTIFPDVLIDRVMPHLSGAEFKVLAYVVRRTFGFKKESDTISLDQICNGITRRDGSVLDEGTGLARKTAVAAIHGLETKGVVLCRRRSSPEKGNLPTSFALRFRGQPLTTPDTEFHQGGREMYSQGGEPHHQAGGSTSPALGTALHPQPTVVQSTVPQGGKRAGELAGEPGGTRQSVPPAAPAPGVTALETVWVAALHQLASKIGEVSFRTWLAPAHLRALEGATATLEVPHALAQRWIERHLRDAICAELAAVTGRELELRLVLPAAGGAGASGKEMSTPASSGSLVGAAAGGEGYARATRTGPVGVRRHRRTGIG